MVKDNIYIDYENDITYPNTENGVFAKNKLINSLNNNAENIFKTTFKNQILKVGDDEFKFETIEKIKFKTQSGFNLINNYNVFLLPNFNCVFTAQNPDKSNYLKLKELAQFNSFEVLYPQLESSPFINNITLQPIPLYNTGDFNFEIVFDVNNPSKDDFVVIVNINNTEKFGLTKILKNGNNYAYCLFKNVVGDYDCITNNLFNNDHNYDNDRTKNFIPNNIGKMHKWPYIRKSIKSTTGNVFHFYPQLLKGNLQLKMSYTWAIDQNHIIYTACDSVESGYYNQPYNVGLSSQEANNYSYLQTSDPYKEYIARNQEKINQVQKYNNDRQIFNGVQTGWNIAKSIIGGLFGGENKKGIGATVSGVGDSILNGASNKMALDNEIAIQKAMLGDLRNSPVALQGNGDDLNGVMTKTSLVPIFIEERLWKSLREKIEWYFQIYGYNMSSVVRNVNEFWETKYYFNYVEIAGELFSYYKEKYGLTDKARQILDMSFQRGVHIWHYRGYKNWRGIKNFDVNNIDL